MLNLSRQKNKSRCSKLKATLKFLKSRRLSKFNTTNTRIKLTWNYQPQGNWLKLRSKNSNKLSIQSEKRLSWLFQRLGRKCKLNCSRDSDSKVSLFPMERIQSISSTLLTVWLVQSCLKNEKTLNLLDRQFVHVFSVYFISKFYIDNFNSTLFYYSFDN